MSGLENRGATFGVHDFSNGQRTREDYHALMTSTAGDTRSRLFGVDSSHGTFNARTRALSYGTAGCNPKGEYMPPRQTASLETLAAEAAWPKAVLGGFVIPFQGSAAGTRPQNLHAAERCRRTGSLGRNIVGSCSIKDDRFVYYGAHGSHHYGNNSDTRSTKQWQVTSR
eukprot:gb/GFBE01034730.1/.p1 GENE.gb/GFBE01034730.1/~~gb/GFBE01034730.1/.p1  ORF type:complete len:169 (+),score=15.13 gb/GFBE01034730.1/:1-507(+)